VIALNIIPFAGIAFLWFIGVLRDRLGQREDRFFATEFFGSGLLFLAMLFAAAAMVGAIILVFAEQPEELVNSATFHFARATIYNLVNIYMIKMAAVFIISTEHSGDPDQPFQAIPITHSDRSRSVWRGVCEGAVGCIF